MVNIKYYINYTVQVKIIHVWFIFYLTVVSNAPDYNSQQALRWSLEEEKHVCSEGKKHESLPFLCVTLASN